MDYPTKIAHYSATKTRKFITIVEADQPYDEDEVIPVSGKVEARRIAAERGAKPWNF